MGKNGDQAEAAETALAAVRSEPRVPALVVGIAAGFGDLFVVAALLSKLASIPDVIGFVCVPEQESFDDKTLLEELRAIGGGAIELAADGDRIGRQGLYLVPAGMLVTLEGGRVKGRSSPEPLGRRGRIDSLLLSIAGEHREHAVAILLNGAGAAGTLGATAVREQGGLAVAQEMPATSGGSYGGSAARVIADHVLPAERIAGCIADHAAYLARREETRMVDDHARMAAEFARLAAIVRSKTGHDLRGYKPSGFLRRVQRRMQVTQRHRIDDYARLLLEDAEEARNLFNDMLIGVTHFFRDAKEFCALETEVIPKLFEGRTAADQLRIWVPGCSTGEEAYSLAMLLREHMARLDGPPHVQIFATDIDGRALAFAPLGRYSAAAVREVTPERLARWFVREGDTWCVAKELREMCVFSRHDVMKDAPFSRLDLVSCRNLLINLDTELQNRVIPLFHFALRQGGFLFLGSNDNVIRYSMLFTPLSRGIHIFRKLEGPTRMPPDLPLSEIAEQPQPKDAGNFPARLDDSNLARRAERIAECHAPAYVVVDERLEVLHFSGGMGRYLDPSMGAATLNLLNLVHNDWRLELQAAMRKVIAEQDAVRMPPLRRPWTGSAASTVRVLIEPMPGRAEDPPHFVVLFQDGDEGGLPQGAGQDSSPVPDDDHVRQLEGELRITRERLQTAVEELEAANRQLQSSNEQYQSINEELQCANEELEASKEELQSVNEELQTVNGELAHRVHELARANSDLKNLLESTQIATIFLDNELRIKNFTPAVTEIFHLMDGDLGQAITDVASRISYDELVEDIRRVMRTLSTIEREVEDPRSGIRYLARVLPYRSIDNFIAGVVLTFLDVTATAKAEKALRASEERFRMMAQAVPAFLATVRPDLRLDYVNPRFYDYTGMSEGTALGEGWLLAVHPDDVEEMQRRWEHSAETGEALEMEQRLRGANGTYRWFMTRAEPERDAAGQVVRWISSTSDIHEQRTAADRQRLLMAELQHRVKNILAVVRSIFARSLGPDVSLEAGADHFRGRLDSLARTQNVLARTPDGGIDLEEMVRDELTSHGAKADDQAHIAGPPVRLRQKAAEALGLAVHELATNASKYGALASDSGRIAVTWRLYDRGAGPRLAWKWVESGVRLVDSSPARIGFGRELIEQGLPYQLGATTALEFANGGVRCAIELPLNDRIVVLKEDEPVWGAMA